jgi:Mce-associated membrane protein
VTSDTRTLPRDDEEAVASPDPAGEVGRATDAGETDGGPRGRRRPAVPLLPALTVLLVLLLGAVGYLWFTRPVVSAVRADAYAEALQAARSGVVDYTSFDYLTLDDDIEQIRRVAVGDLRTEGVKKLDEGRAAFTQAKFVVNTKIVGAGVTRVDGDEATALMKIQATQESSASKQAEVTSYQIEVTLKKSGDRWLLSGLKGTGTPGDD